MAREGLMDDCGYNFDVDEDSYNSGFKDGFLMAVDEFAEKLNKKITEFVLEHQNQLTFVSGVSMGWKFVDEIAEQMKEE